MRYLLKDLVPGKTYYLQFRSKDASGGTSDWSRVFQITASADTLAPKAPTGVTVTPVGNAFQVAWNAVTESTDNSPATDLRHYLVKVESSLAPGITKTYVTPDTKFEFTFARNLETFTTPRGTIGVSVSAIDMTGNPGAYSSVVTASNPAPANPTGFTGVAVPDGVSLKWTGVADADLAGYRVYSGTSVGTQSTLEWTGSSTSTIVSSVSYFTDKWYKVAAYDIFGTESAVPPVVGPYKPTSPFLIDSLAPDVPTGLAATLTTLADYSGASMAVSWTAVADPTGDLSGYRIGYRPVGASDWQYTDVDAGAGTTTSTLIDKLTALVNYEVRIRSYDFQANYSAWSSTVTTSTAATNTAPPTPTAPTIATDRMKMQVTIPGTKASDGLAMPADVVYYEVYASATNGFTPDASNMVGTIAVGPAMIADFYIAAFNTSGTTMATYVRIMAVDKGGLKSAASAQATNNILLISTTNIADAAITNAKIGTVEAQKITAGTGLVNDLTVKSTLTLGDAGTDGIIKSFDWVSNTTGYRMTKNSLEINGGSIAASALKLQTGHNMMPIEYADFEYGDYYYTDPFWNARGQAKIYNTGSAGSITSTSTTRVFGSQSLTLGNFAPGSLTCRLAPNNTTYNIPVDPNGVYYLSAYLMNYGPGAATWTMRVIGNNSAVVATADFAHTSAEGAFTRRGLAVTIPGTGVTSVVVEFTCPDTTVQKSVAIDGVQFEPIVAGLIQASSWKPSSSTVIDGSGVTTGYLRSVADINVSGVNLPMWSINKAGNMQVGDALIRGKLVVGTTSEAPINRAPNNGDFESNVTGYQVYAAGATGTSITRTTTVGEVISGTGSAKVAAAAGTKTRLGLSWSASGYPEGYKVRLTGSAKVNTTDAGSTIRIFWMNAGLATLDFVDVVQNPVADVIYDFDYTYTVEVGQVPAVVGITHATGTTITSTSFIVDDLVLTDNVYVGNSYVTSPDYVQGQTGWRITGDGNAEFNNGVFRGTLGANMVTGDTLSGNIVLASTIVAGEETGRRVEFSDRGMQLWEADGTMIIDFPTDPTRSASISGDLLATSLTISDQLSIRGSVNELAKGSSLTIASGTTAPNSPPTVSVGFESVGWTYDAAWDPYKYGFAWDNVWNSGGGCFLTVQNIYGGNASIGRLYKDTGLGIPWSAIALSRIRVAYGGITVLGGNAYVLGQDINGTWYIEGRSLATKAKVLDVPYVNSTSKYTPTIGNDGTNLMVGYMKTADRKASYQFVNPSTGAGVGSVVNTDYVFGAGKNELSFIGKGTFDFGTTRVVIARRGWYNVYVYDSAGVKLTGTSAEDWVCGGNVTGMAYTTIDANPNSFYVYDAVGAQIVRQSNYRWAGTATTESNFWVANTWYDNSTAPAELFNVTNKALTTNVATLTTSAPHGLVTGNSILVAGVDATFNGTYTITAYTSSTLSYAKTATNVTSQAATGTVGEVSTTHETNMGPLKNFTMAKRQSVTVTVPPLPIRPIPNTGDDAAAARIYMAKGSITPDYTKMDRQATLANDVRVGYFSHSQGVAISVPAANAVAGAGEQPPSTNGFAGVVGAAAVLKSSNDQFSVDGLGAGNWGGITVASNGNVTIHGSDMTDTGWLTSAGFTATANCTLNTYWVRRIGKLCMGYFNVTLTNALADGNFGNITLVNVPVGWRTSTQNGQVSGGTAGVGIDGAVTTANGIIIASGNGAAAAGAALSLSVTWFID